MTHPASYVSSTHLQVPTGDKASPGQALGLTDISIDYGPRQLLGRFFLSADTLLQQMGITLTFGTFDDVMEANRNNRDSWFPIVPTFNPDNGLCDPDWAYALIGRLANGTIVTVQAARIFDWRSTNFKAEAESRRLFYANPASVGRPQERCGVTAPTAALLGGTVAFSGGAWWHPQVRGKLLGSILSRVSRAYAYTHWHADLTMAVMSKPLINRGFAARNGYQHCELGFTLRNFELGDYDGGAVWIMADEMLSDLSAFVDSLAPELSTVGDLRRA